MLIGKHPALSEVINTAGIVGSSDVTTLILGESGTGKEVLARHIHRHSPRADASFISVNCASLPENLAESLLFGHRKGAFTDAKTDNPGYLAAADGGTLFLDEIAELPLPVQAKLLRFLESGEVLRVGDASPRHVDVRVIAATHRDLQQAVSEGRFRQDLFYRLYVVPLQLPPLRERGADIKLLLEHFMQQMADKHGLAPARLSTAALKQLQGHDWPGNVRELRNLCERLTILLSDRTIEPANLPVEYRHPAGTTQQTSSGFTLPEHGIALAELEQDLIVQALERTAGNRSRAARLLGLTRDTLLYRLKKFAIG